MTTDRKKLLELAKEAAETECAEWTGDRRTAARVALDSMLERFASLLSAAQAEREPVALTCAEIERGWNDTFSTRNPFCPCDLGAFTKSVRWAERNIRSLKRPSQAQEPTIERDWAEDFSHENGNYDNRCSICERFFVGHKRRVICKACSSASGAGDELPGMWGMSDFTGGETDNQPPPVTDEIAKLKQALVDVRVKHEVACSTLEIAKEQRTIAQRALAYQCEETKRLRAAVELSRAKQAAQPQVSDGGQKNG